jgi:DNA transformation protein and related proteins
VRLRQAWRIHPGRTTPLPDPVSSIPNLGPASEAAFARAGITSAAELRDLGADEAYARLLASGSRPHFIGYYVLVMGLQGRPWNDCKGEEKKALRKRFDAICAGFNRSDAKQTADLEQELQFLGVIPRK